MSSAAAPRVMRLLAGEALPLIGERPAVGPAILRARPAADALEALGLVDSSDINADLHAWFVSVSERYLEISRLSDGIQQGEIEKEIRRSELAKGVTVDTAYDSASIDVILEGLQELYMHQGVAAGTQLLQIGDRTAAIEANMLEVDYIVRDIVAAVHDLAPGPGDPAGELDFLAFKHETAAILLDALPPTTEPAALPPAELPPPAVVPPAGVPPAGVPPAVQPHAVQPPAALPPVPSPADVPDSLTQGPTPAWFEAFDELIKGGGAPHSEYATLFKPEWITPSSFRHGDSRAAIGRMATHSRDVRITALLVALADANNFPRAFTEKMPERERFIRATKAALLLAYRVEWGVGPTTDEQNTSLADNGTAWMTSFAVIEGLVTWSERVRKVAGLV